MDFAGCRSVVFARARDFAGYLLIKIVDHKWFRQLPIDRICPDKRNRRLTSTKIVDQNSFVLVPTNRICSGNMYGRLSSRENCPQTIDFSGCQLLRYHFMICLLIDLSRSTCASYRIPNDLVLTPSEICGRISYLRRRPPKPTASGKILPIHSPGHIASSQILLTESRRNMLSGLLLLVDSPEIYTSNFFHLQSSSDLNWPRRFRMTGSLGRSTVRTIPIRWYCPKLIVSTIVYYCNLPTEIFVVDHSYSWTIVLVIPSERHPSNSIGRAREISW